MEVCFITNIIVTVIKQFTNQFAANLRKKCMFHNKYYCHSDQTVHKSIRFGGRTDLPDRV